MYPSKKLDKEFLYNYLNRLTKIKAPTTNLIEEYLHLLTPEEQKDSKVIKLIVDNGTFNNSKLQLGIAIDVLKSNLFVFEDLKSKSLIKQNLTFKQIEQNAMDNSLSLAIKNKDNELFKKVYELTPDYNENKFENKETLKIQYFFEIKEYTKFKLAAKEFINNKLLKIPSDSLEKWDKNVYEEVKKSYFEKNDEKINLNEKLFSYLHTQTIQLTNYLNVISNNFLKIQTNTEEIKLAKYWSSIALKKTEINPKYYANVYTHYQKTYLTSIYKLGDKATALQLLEKLIVELPSWYHNTKRQILVDLLEEMKANKLA